MTCRGATTGPLKTSVLFTWSNSEWRSAAAKNNNKKKKNKIKVLALFEKELKTCVLGHSGTFTDDK